MISCPVTYCGFATITKFRSNKKIGEWTFKNRGTNKLFTALAAVLCGQDQRVNMPKYFDLGRYSVTNDVTSTYISALSSRVTLTSKLVKNLIKETTDGNGKPQIVSAGVAAVFTAFIPTRLIQSEDSIQVLSIYSKHSDNDRDSLLAEINLTSDFEQLDQSGEYNYMIEWTMTFDNVVTVTEPSQSGGSN